jgi:hypothetical protein
MILPCTKVVRAVDPNSAAFLLLLGLVFTKPEVLSSDMIPSHTTSVGVDGVAICISPSAAWSNPLARCEGGKQETSNDGFERRHVGNLEKLSINQPRLVVCTTLHMIYYSQADDRLSLPRRPNTSRNIVCGSTWRRRRNSDFSVDDHLLALERGVVLDIYELYCF